jgi:mono/diheme cytochrome c family protein
MTTLRLESGAHRATGGRWPWLRLAAPALVAALLGLPLTAQTPAKVDAAALYKSKCQACHLAKGDNKNANMSFTDGIWRHGSSVKEVSDAIRNGVKGTLMTSFKGKLTDAEIEALARYVRAFDSSLKD